MSLDLIRSHDNKDDLITYYRRLKNNMYHMYGEETVKENCLKLVAIALALQNGFYYSLYYDSVFSDIQGILESQKKKPAKITEVAKKMDNAGGHIIPSKDHHELDSQAEADIDDILFDLQRDPALLSKKKAPYHIPHYDVTDITERGVNADWCVGLPYYPAAIFYIEYWGVKNDPAYERNRKEKEELYTKHGISLLSIEAEEVKSKNTLTEKIKSFIMERVDETR